MKPVYDHRKTYVIPRSRSAGMRDCRCTVPRTASRMVSSSKGLVLFAYVRIYAKMATLPDLNKALRGVAAEKLDQRCSRDDLDEISKSLTRWPEVSPFMGLSEADEEEVKDGQALRRQRVDVLRRWRKNRKESATYRWVVGRAGGGGGEI